MKREYQSAVHFRKESKQEIKFGIAVLVFILGIVMFGIKFQYKSMQISAKWFYRYAGADTLLVICTLIWGLFCSFGMDHELAFAIDNNEQGIWLSSMRNYQMIYIPFSMVEITCARGMLTFKYQNAFCYNRNQKIRMLAKGLERIRISAVDEDELKAFVADFNQLTSKARMLELDDGKNDEQSFLKFEPAASKILFLLGICGITLFNPLVVAGLSDHSSSSHDVTSTENASYFKNEDLHFNQVYSTKDLNIEINKGYLAQTSAGKQVVIFNVTVTGKKSDADIGAGDFYLTSDKDVIKDGNEYVSNPLNATTLSVGGKPTPVVNQLDNDDNYCSPEFDGGKKLTFNVVFSLSDLKKTNYFIYSNFGFDDPDGYENKPAYIFKFDPQKLEVLK